MGVMAIDLSTKNCGICIDGETYSVILWNDDFKTRHSLLQSFVKLIKDCDINEVLVELGNFGNANTTNKFNLLLGELQSYLFLMNENINIKAFNSNEWRRLLDFSNLDSREICKIKARVICVEKTCKLKYCDNNFNCWEFGELKNIIIENDEYIKNKQWERLNMLKATIKAIYNTTQWKVPDDETDAFCIWYVRDYIRDSRVIKDEVRIKNNENERIGKLKKKVKMLKNKIAKWLDTPSKQAKIREWRAKIENIEKEIKE